MKGLFGIIFPRSYVDVQTVQPPAENTDSSFQIELTLRHSTLKYQCAVCDLVLRAVGWRNIIIIIIHNIVK